MTQNEWEICSDPQVMLTWLREQGKLSERKARLLAVAACRSSWTLLDDGRSRRAVEAAERVADGRGTPDDLRRAESDAEAAYEETRPAAEAARFANGAAVASGSVGRPAGRAIAASFAAFAVAGACREVPAEAAGEATFGMTSALVALTVPLGLGTGAWESGWRSIERSQAALVRSLWGPPPFRPVTVSPASFTPSVVALATAIYADKAFDRLPILADGLEEAGCTDAELLQHLRGPGPFVRGDWALDLILQKE